MKQHLFDYKPGNSKVLCMEYLCDCTECLKFDFQNCIKTSVPKVAPVPIDHEKECELDKMERMSILKCLNSLD